MKNSDYVDPLGAQISQIVTEGGLLLTANGRLSRHLRAHHDRYQQSQGRTWWESPPLLPLLQWVELTWTEVCDSGREEVVGRDRVVLSLAQERALWEEIVRHESATHHFLHYEAVASQAHEAWRYLRQWGVTLQQFPELLNSDATLFKQWASVFQRRCVLNQFIDNASVTDWLIKNIGKGVVTLPQHIVLAGFDELTPQQQRLVAVLTEAGCRVTPLTPPQHEPLLRLSVVPNIESEIYQAALWAQAFLEQQPMASIAIVVPDLEIQRERVVRLFTEIFHPEALLGHGVERPLFALSLGQPLHHTAAVRHLLTGLRLFAQPSPAAQWESWLTSPFWAAAEGEMAQRATLALRLLNQRQYNLTLKAVLAHSTYLRSYYQDEHYCAQLSPLLERLAVLFEALPKTQRASQWAHSFAELTHLLGWPGERTVNHEESQLVAAWEQLLDQLSCLDLVTSPLSYQEALSHLKSIAAHTIFHLETAATPIQLLEFREASGIDVDALWVMGMHDEQIPAAPHPNPFIPLALQRHGGFPRATPQRERQVAQAVIERLQRSAREVIFSYPSCEQERVLRASPLLPKGIEVTSELVAYRQELLSERLFHTTELEVWQDEKGPALRTVAVVKGGVGIFKHQAACPFRAFSYYRLGAQPRPSAEIGLNPAERGSLIHRVLEQFWQRIGDHTTLVTLEATPLSVEVERAVASTLAEYGARLPHIMTPRYTALERNRLIRLLTAWLEIEKQRAPFRVIEVEQKKSLSIAGLNVETKVDRIDELADGSHLIMDYKTGQASVRGWFGQRPDEPQLPLYCINSAANIQGVVFAQLKTGELRLHGLAQQEDIAPGIELFTASRCNVAEISWEGLLTTWRTTLTTLAEQFLRGAAAVDPKESTTCQYCTLQSFCRIYEQETSVVETDDDSETPVKEALSSVQYKGSASNAGGL